MSKALAIGNANFDQEALQATELVLVEFGATWCPPCRRLEPELDAVAEEMQGLVKVVKVDVDESPELGEKYGVRGIPQMTFLKGGKVLESMVGLAPKAQIVARLKAHL